MKKARALSALSTLSALASVSPAATAQPGLVLYGVADAGIHHVRGLRGGPVSTLASGIMEGSRLGVRGSEDLGAGWRVVFAMEHRAELDTGGISNRPLSRDQLPDRLSQAAHLGLPGSLQPAASAVAGSIGSTVGANLAGSFWDRQVHVGLVTPAGAVLAGRQYTPAYEVTASFDTLATQSSLAAGQVAAAPTAIDLRVGNAVAWRMQKGLYAASAMLGAGENQPSTGRFVGGMAMVRKDTHAAGVGYNSRRNERGGRSLRTVAAGASAKVGRGRLHGLALLARDENPSGVSTIAAQLTPTTGSAAAGLVQSAFVRALRQDGRLWHVGYKLPVGAHAFYLAYTRWNDRTAANADVASYGMAWSHALSPRTDLNLVLARFDNRHLGQAAPGGAGFFGGVTASAGRDATGVAFGLRHRF